MTSQQTSVHPLTANGVWRLSGLDSKQPMARFLKCLWLFFLFTRFKFHSMATLNPNCPLVLLSNLHLLLTTAAKWSTKDASLCENLLPRHRDDKSKTTRSFNRKLRRTITASCFNQTLARPSHPKHNNDFRLELNSRSLGFEASVRSVEKKKKVENEKFLVLIPSPKNVI